MSTFDPPLRIYFVEMCKQCDTLAYVMNCIVINFSYHRCVFIALGVLTNTQVISMLIHSSFCELNFVLLACLANFSEVAHAT
jgi:hypothetical protein